MPASTTTPKRVAILGGGLGSLVTALELTRPGVNAGEYDITIYQMGHRLGGKGASGRNAEQHDRNEEHGLHVWLGFYENAFRLMRELLVEWNIPSTHPWSTADAKDRWTAAFKPHSYAPLTERKGDHWELWNIHFEERKNGTPGDGLGADEDMWSFITSLHEALLRIFEEDHPAFADQAARQEAAPQLTKVIDKARQAQPHAAAKSGCFSLLGLHRPRLLKMVEDMCGLSAHELLGHPDESLRRLGMVLNLGWSLLRGIISNYRRIVRGTLDALDDKDLRQFLREHGASEAAVLSPLTSALYDAIFAWKNGDPATESLAAGAGIRCLLRIFFSYKQALSWKMQAGMGDTIFTPMYEVLKQRGVKIKFFHEVKNLTLSADKKRIEKIVMARQVTLANGASNYEPLVQINGLGCWPSRPRWEQIVEAAQIQAGGHNLEHANNGWACPETFELVSQRDFDRVVLGISIGALPSIASELISASRPFAAMVEHVATVRTMAWQAWLNKKPKDLGWEHEPPVLSNFLDPLNTWADMTFLLPRENNPDAVRSLHYFCGPLRSAVPVGDALAETAKQRERLRDELANTFWPKAEKDGVFDVGLIEHEYLRANTNPSDLYVLTLPGTTRHRLRPNESGFENLTLAGDWTRNQFNVGCVEATVMSGRLASQAISGRPRNDEIPYSTGP